MDGTAGQEAEVIAHVRQLNRQLLDGFLALDADRLMRHYWNSPELFTIGEGGGVTMGWEAAKRFQEGFFAATEAIDLTFEEWWHATSTDGVLAATPFRLTARFKGGGERTLEGWYTNFRRRIDGEWLIVFEHVSANAPVPAGN